MSIETEVANTKTTIKVKVSFPIAKGGPFQATFASDTAAGAVLADAMSNFEVHDDSQFTYVLAHDGVEVDPAATLDSLAGHAHDVRFTLVKKITQG